MTQSARVGSESAALSKVVAGTEGAYTTNTATTLTLTAAQAIDGFFDQTGGTTCALTLPTAAAIVAAIPGVAVGSKFDFSVCNSGGSGIVTVTTNTGLTLVGVMTVATTVASHFRGVVTNATSGAEAVKIMSVK